MELEILKKNIQDILIFADDLQQIHSKKLNISGTMQEVANYIGTLKSIKASAEICRIALERFEDV